jgi:hypothetical protein
MKRGSRMESYMQSNKLTLLVMSNRILLYIPMKIAYYYPKPYLHHDLGEGKGLFDLEQQKIQ